MAERGLAGIAAELYALPFDDFVAGRNAAAKALLAETAPTPELRARAAEVRALPKPSVGAWAVNMLAWQQPAALHGLVDLGRTMRQAQNDLDAAALRTLARERRTLLAAAVDAARAAAAQRGRKISGTVAAEVEQTLRAATADEGAAAAVGSGRLLRALAGDGVDVVDLDGAVAVPDAPPAAAAAPPAAAASTPAGSPPPAGRGKTSGAAGRSRTAGAAPVSGKPGSTTPPPTGEPRLRAVRPERPAPSPTVRKRAEAALQEAQAAAEASAEEAARTAGEREDAEGAAAALAEEVSRLRQELSRTEYELRRARKQLDHTSATAQQAGRAAAKDRRREELARQRVLRLGNTPDR
ncbi:hypothetical protein [Arthrobacter sp. Soil763]|uniref:hypothetical protein n=1 Tax=Arthrobacter sp. Soil763 TaxID=1736402 RepID=UPI0006F68A63|nr:hypothetical protein [Arthrobacter sp. Soil763]KRE81543.1 hypothetical protein ASG71_00165 [Arthrobacter sp. Soil763]